MNFNVAQSTIQAAIAGNALFAADAATTVLKDNGASKSKIEKAFLEKGYVITVWPAVRGRANQGDDSDEGVTTQTVVRMCINPQKLKAVRAANQSDGGFINDYLAAVIASVLAVAPDPPGVRFQLDPDAFELISFDEGMVAYHIRFSRFVVFGT